MKANKFIFLILLQAVFLGNVYSKSIASFSFQHTVIELPDSADAAKENKKPDVYTKALTAFDLQLRLGTLNNPDQAAYLNKSAKEVRSWSQEEQKKIRLVFDSIANFLAENNIALKLPQRILVIKTNGAEEMGADGYTRQNRIMLYISDINEITVHLLAHEFFHVYSRYNEEKRNMIYSIFGFEKCNRIETGEAMNHHVITNPDCPFTEHFISLQYNDKQCDMVLQLYSKKNYKPSYDLGDYMNVGLLEVAGDNKTKHPKTIDGNGIIHNLDEVPDLINKIGKNTSYVLHPEEIAAENFALWVSKSEVPQPQYFEKIKVILD